MPPRPRRRDRDDRAVLYLRQSVLKEESVSISQQETACRDYCRRMGYTIVDEPYIDEGVSASKVRLAKRENVQRALQAIDEGRADVLVAWKGSRVARNRLDAEIAKERVAEAGGRIESATEPNDETASGRFATGMLAEVAAFEAARIGEDWKLTHARRRKAGLPAQGGRRYGYDQVRDDRGKVIGYRINDTEAAVLRWMYNQVIDGHGAPYIARELNRRGVPNPVGRTWPQVGIYPLLDSGFAAGLISWRERHPSDGRPKGDRVFYDGAHDPIIDQATWDTYRAQRRRSSYQPARAKEAQYRLSSLVVCGDCGALMWPTSGARGGTGKGMVCGRWQSRGEGRCVTAVTANLENAVKAWLADHVPRLDSSAAANAATERLIQAARRDEQTAVRAVNAVEAKLTKLNRAWIEGMVPDAGYAATRDEYLAELDAAKRDVEAAQDEVLLRRVPSRQEAQTVLDEWETLPIATIRNVLAELIDRVVVHPPAKRYAKGTVEIVGKYEPF